MIHCCVKVYVSYPDQWIHCHVKVLGRLFNLSRQYIYVCLLELCHQRVMFKGMMVVWSHSVLKFTVCYDGDIILKCASKPNGLCVQKHSHLLLKETCVNLWNILRCLLDCRQIM